MGSKRIEILLKTQKSRLATGAKAEFMNVNEPFAGRA
jgi:hypothetical protein